MNTVCIWCAQAPGPSAAPCQRRRPRPASAADSPEAPASRGEGSWVWCCCGSFVIAFSSGVSWRGDGLGGESCAPCQSRGVAQPHILPSWWHLVRAKCAKHPDPPATSAELARLFWSSGCGRKTHSRKTHARQRRQLIHVGTSQKDTLHKQVPNERGCLCGARVHPGSTQLAAARV